jgi:hypothetical protein
MPQDDSTSIERYDAEERWRCPMLGGPVTFGYCRRMSSGLPCSKVLECWLSRFPLVDFLKANYSPEELQRVFAAEPKGRLARMMEALEDARKIPPADGAAGDP